MYETRYSYPISYPYTVGQSLQDYKQYRAFLSVNWARLLIGSILIFAAINPGIAFIRSKIKKDYLTLSDYGFITAWGAGKGLIFFIVAWIVTALILNYRESKAAQGI